MRCFTSLALAGAFGTLVATAAQAADMAFPPMEGTPAVSQQPVELGTGWYLRGDAAWSRDQVPALSSNMSLTAQTALTNGYSLDFGFGYKFNNWLRADIVYDYRKPQSASAAAGNVWCPYSLIGLSDQTSNPIIQYGYYANPNDTCSPQQSAKLSRQDLLLNGYIDLGNWGGVTPYVGAGAGFVRTENAGTLNYYETANGTLYNANLTPGATVGTAPNTTVNPNGYPPQWVNSSGTAISPQPAVSFTQQNWNKVLRSTTYHFAWALMGGFAIDLTDHLQVDLGYRYVNFGISPDIAATSSGGEIVKERQWSQEIRVGFRYMAD